MADTRSGDARSAPQNDAQPDRQSDPRPDHAGPRTDHADPVAVPQSDPPADPQGEALARLRDRILELDRSLIELVDERRALVLEVGRLKGELGLPVLDPAREARVVRRAAQLARERGVDEEMVRDVVWRIIASARDAQEDRSRWGPPPAPADRDDVEKP